MLIDIRELDRGRIIESDVCIIGAGSAGITLARQFRSTSLRVVLLESGGVDHEPQVQSLAEGENHGLDYYRLDDARLRFFGGTTSIWGGRCAGLDSIDFRHRPWVPYSGWPIGESDLLPWYRLAREELGLPEPLSEDRVWTGIDIDPLRFNPDQLRYAFWQFDGQAARFSVENCSDLRGSPNITAITHATVHHIQAAADGETVAHVDIADLYGHRNRIRSRYFILASGGLENARLLLSANDVHPNGLGNGSDLVGRFFMEHPHARGGRIVTPHPWALLRLFSNGHRLGGRRIAACLRPAEAIQESRQGLNSSFILDSRLHPDGRLPVAMRLYNQAKHGLTPSRSNRRLWLTTKRAVHWLQQYTDPFRPWLQTRLGMRGIYAVIRAEQSPNPDSRVRLGDARDPLGMRRLVLDWRLTELDKHGVRIAMETLDQELRRLGLGHVEYTPWLMDPERVWEFDPLISAHPIGGYHHMGTTRMADHPSRGVVDANGRLFGLSNLFVAGSSVFPTGGWANPTLTILALSLRLGQHVRQLCEDESVPSVDDIDRYDAA